MDPHAGKIVINGAPSQFDRWLEALGSNYARPDERTYTELLDFSVRFGSLIRFYNLENKPEGDWTPFFLSDPTLILASLDATNLGDWEARYLLAEKRTREAVTSEEKFEGLRNTFTVIFELAREIDLWLVGLELNPENPPARLLQGKIAGAVRSELGNALRRLKANDEGAGLPWALDQPIGLNFVGFGSIWNLNTVVPDGGVYQGNDRAGKISHVLNHLSSVFRTFLDAISEWKPLAREQFQATVNGGRHKPHLALYMAFARLFETAQDTLNTFSDRYRHFYYHDILREKPHGPIPDQTFLTFQLAEDENVRSATVPRGTFFPAGQDANDKVILYESDRDLTVTGARLEKVRAVRVLDHDVDSGTSGMASVQPDEKRILSTEVLFDSDLPTGLQDENGLPTWKTFGETMVGTTEITVTRPASIGFAIASEYLLLTGGHRTVTLTIGYPLEFETVLAERLTPLALATGLTSEEIFRQVLAHGFTLYLSTSDDWLEVQGYEVFIPPTNPTGLDSGFELTFKLTHSAPAIVALPDSDLQTEQDVPPLPDFDHSNPAPDLPTLKAYVNQKKPVVLVGPTSTVSVFPLTILDGLPVTTLLLNVRTQKLENLSLVNTDGLIDASVPFLPFGGIPVVGSYLLVQSQELFAKKLSTLSFGMKWFNLPQNETGFTGYYKDYRIGLDGLPNPDLFDNQKFRGKITVVNPGFWTLEADLDDSLDPYLFRTRLEADTCTETVPDKDGPLCAETLFSGFKVSNHEVPPYYDQASSALRLEFTEPAYGFGNDLYSKNVLNAVISDLPDTDLCREKCLFRCAPIQEAISAIEICLVCLAGCGPDAENPGITNDCVATCLEELNRLASECVPKCSDNPVFLTLAGKLEQVQELPSPQRSQAIKKIREQFVEAARTGGGSSRGLTECNPCVMVLDALTCVTECTEAGQTNPDSTPSTLADCLTECLTKLNAGYAACLEACMDACMTPQRELQYPNEPYLPQVSNLWVNYSSTCKILPTDDDGRNGWFFHLLPFNGFKRIELENTPTLVPFFPNDGNLYLGFQGLQSPQTLTLFFQMTSEASAGDDQPAISWAFLSENRWCQLPVSGVLFDTTNGLRNTGIVALALPFFQSSENSILTSKNQWLRAAVQDGAGGFPQTVAIIPNAVIVSWYPSEVTGEHLRQPLPAGTITSSVEDLPDISTILQPTASFGGRPPETVEKLEIRVGERLRHKDRAILGWDYERLVLERFPNVWKVQILPARNRVSGGRPGNVLVVVVPGPDGNSEVSSTAPSAPSVVLNRIRAYLEERSNPFEKIHVVNPQYVRIRVSTAVLFRDQNDPGTAAKRLNDDLVKYLSPWFYDAERASRNGHYASESDISEFIQTRPYIASVEALSFAYLPELRADLEWYFLTSAEDHDITDVGSHQNQASPGY